jgi:hypothetical protein
LPTHRVCVCVCVCVCVDTYTHERMHTCNTQTPHICTHSHMKTCTHATHTQHTHTHNTHTHTTHTHTQHTRTRTQHKHTHNTHTTSHTQACGSRWGAVLPPIYREHILSIENIFYLSHDYYIPHTGMWSRGGGPPSLLALPRLSCLLHPVLEPGG